MAAAATDTLKQPLQKNIQRSSSVPYLVLLSLNNTFERKCIPLPFAPDSLRIGRQTNAKTSPTRDNGFFDSRVLSRQHAQVWAEPISGRVFIKDIKSSNGTFVNSRRLSNENQESEPQELKKDDSLELGIDILSEDGKTVIHHKVAARVEHAGFHPFPGIASNLNISLADIDPDLSNSPSPLTRRNSAQQPYNKAVNVSVILKRLNDELRSSKAVASELQWTKGVFDELEGFISHKSFLVTIPTNSSSDNVPNGLPQVPVSENEESNSANLLYALQRAREENILVSAKLADVTEELQKEQNRRIQAEKRLETLTSSQRNDILSNEVSVHELSVVSGDDVEMSRDVDKLQDLVREAHTFAKECQDKARHAEALSEQKLRELEQLQKQIELSSESSTVSEEDAAYSQSKGRRRRRFHEHVTQGKEIKRERLTPLTSAFGVVIVGIGIFAIVNGYLSLRILSQMSDGIG